MNYIGFRSRKITALTLAVLMILTMLPAMTFAQESPKYYDGTYEGVAKGIGQLQVLVTIQNDLITGITVPSHPDELDSIWSRVDPAYINRIIDAQSTKVDAISTATVSSNGVRDAVNKALLKANALPLISPGNYTDVGAEMWNELVDGASMMAPIFAKKAELEVQQDGKVYATIHFVPGTVATVAIGGNVVKRVTSKINGSTLAEISEEAVLLSSSSEETVFKMRVFNVLEPTLMEVFHTGMNPDGGTNKVRLYLNLGSLLPGMDIAGERIEPLDEDFDNDGVPNGRDYFPRNPQRSYDPALQTVRNSATWDAAAIPTTPDATVSQADFASVTSLTTVRKLLDEGFSVYMPTAYADALLASDPGSKLKFSLTDADDAALTKAAALTSAQTTVMSFSVVAQTESAAGAMTALDGIGGEFLVNVDLNDEQVEALEGYGANTLYYYDPQTGELEKADAYFLLNAKLLRLFTARTGSYVLTTQPLPAFSQVSWAQTFGGSGSDLFTQVAVTADSGFIAVGTSNSADGDLDGQEPGAKGIAVKYDARGELEWIYAIPSTTLMNVAELPGGGYALCGSTTLNAGLLEGLNRGVSDAVAILLSPEGELEFARNLGSFGTDYFYSVIAEDDGFAAFGHIAGANGDFAGLQFKGGSDGMAVKFDLDGDIIWETTFGGDGSDTVNAAVRGVDGGYYVTGNTYSVAGDFAGQSLGRGDAYVVKLSNGGNLSWAKIYGTSKLDSGIDLLVLNSGEPLVFVQFQSDDETFQGLYIGSQDIALLRLSPDNGGILGKMVTGSNLTDAATAVLQMPDGRIRALFTSGSMDTYPRLQGYFGDLFYENDIYQSQGAWLETDANGAIINRAKYIGRNLNDQISGVSVTADGGVLGVGRTMPETEGLFSGMHRGSISAAIVKFDGTSAAVIKNALGALITKAKDVSGNPLKAGLWARFSAALERAELIYANSYASQAAVDSMTSELQTAMDELDAFPEVTWTNLTANGDPGNVNTTELTLSFDADPVGLTAAHIILTGAAKGVLSGEGLTRTLTVSDITVANNANLTITLKSPDGIFISPASKTVPVSRSMTVHWTGLSVNAPTDGIAMLTFAFDGAPLGLNLAAITVDGATKGTSLGGVAATLTRTLQISNITGETITVSLANTTQGYSFEPASRSVVPALTPPSPGDIEDGEYTIVVAGWHGSMDQASMLNPLLDPVARLSVSGGQITAAIRIQRADLGMLGEYDGTAISEVWPEPASDTPTSGTGVAGTLNAADQSKIFIFPLSTLDSPRLAVNVVPMGSVQILRLIFDLGTLTHVGQEEPSPTPNPTSAPSPTPAPSQAPTPTQGPSQPQEPDLDNLTDGVYRIGTILRQYATTSLSMGNGAIDHSQSRLVVQGGQAEVRLVFQPLRQKLGSLDFVGYLLDLWRMDDIVSSGGVISSFTPVPAAVYSEYTGVTDDYGPPSGRWYPKELGIYVTVGEEYTPVRVSVPVMESIGEATGTPGMGLQPARLQLDWNSLSRIGGGGVPDDPVTEPRPTSPAEEPATEPEEPITEPVEPTTEPGEPVTEPGEPEEPTTEPPVTDPEEPVTEPDSSEPDPSEPNTSDPSDPEATEPNEPEEPPATEPPATEPPVTNPPGGGNDNNINNAGGGGGSGAGTGTWTAPVGSGNVSVDYTQSGGSITLSLPNSTVNSIISGSTGLASIDLSKAANATAALLPKEAVTRLADAALAIEIKLPQGSVTLSYEAAKSAAAQAAGSNLSLEVKPVALSSLNARQQAAVGNAPVYDISLTSSSQYITSFGGGQITIALPYTLKPGESPAGVVVWYLDGQGSIQRMNTMYDVRTETVIFTTDHLSLYAIAYDSKAAAAAKAWVNPFGDVQESDWFYGDVAYANANGLFGGTSAATFSPNAPMSRAMLVTVMGRLAGANVSGYANTSNFGDVTTVQYYAPYAQWAQASAIVNGTGDGIFAPNAPISRQDLAVVLMNYVRYTGKSLPVKQAYNGFADEAAVAGYAKASVEAIYRAGIMGGRPGSLFDPKGSATRAEVAAILRRYIEVSR